MGTTTLPAAPPTASATLPDGDRYRVIAHGLNMRREPRATADNLITVLPKDAVVVPIGSASDVNWLLVAAKDGGSVVNGYVARRFLRPELVPAAPPTVTGISAVHLTPPKKTTITRTSADWMRAFPIGDADKPARAGTTPDARKAELGAIIDWLEVDVNPRYTKAGRTTYCNIYAYDFCSLAGVYLPRVWWTPSALLTLGRGEAVGVKYGETVQEMRANHLYQWMREFGAGFGWTPEDDLEELQTAANAGEVCVIVASTETDAPGHIAMVVPETAKEKATKEQNVYKPLQSQAGGTNYKYGHGGTRGKTQWWELSNLKDHYGFWRHA
jgi:hypothetical protein